MKKELTLKDVTKLRIALCEVVQHPISACVHTSRDILHVVHVCVEKKIEQQMNAFTKSQSPVCDAFVMGKSTYERKHTTTSYDDVMRALHTYMEFNERSFCYTQSLNQVVRKK